ncbi:MAG: filamentous hemagglutinin N-terminal domain-containing protein [Proteobacteria bacterium]|nr:filamentous hemagglutinin N-terminal domain-containing protein [Pseudomonadota bacterium]
MLNDVSNDAVTDRRVLCLGRGVRVLASLVCAGLMFVQPILVPLAQAQQITDPRAPIQFRPSTGVSGNGTPLVNITTPSFGGISHNRFERYNVDTRGVILNNSGYGGTSVLGGAVNANPNLTGRAPASVILNEVTGTSASTLNGPTEVFGARADVIIANPNGVGCVGCTFINAGRVTLSTGTPVPDYTLGTVRYSVTGGTVSVSGSGLQGGNGEKLGNIDLIGRQIRVEGPVVASGAVRLRAGAIDYDQAADSLTTLAGAAPVTGAAIASTSTGTIRAGTLSVLSQDVDLGVSLQGALTALSGEISLRSKGDLAVGDAAAASDITVQADGSVLLSGRKEALGRLSVRGRRVELDLSSTIAANNAIVIEALEGLVARGTLASGQDISLTAGGNLVASGTITSLGRIVLEGGSIFASDLGISGEHVTLAGLVSVTLNNTGLRSQSDVAVSGDAISLGAGTGFDAAGTLRINARDALTTATVLDYANLDLTIRNQLVVSATGAIVQDALLLNIRDSIDNQGLLYGRNSTSITTGDLANAGAGVIYGASVTVSLAGQLTNLGRMVSDRTLSILAAGLVRNDGILQAQGDLTLTAAAYRANSADAVLAGAQAFIVASGAFENAGRVLGVNGLSLRAASLINTGSLVSGRAAALTVSGDIRNDGSIGATTDLTIVAGGSIRSNGHLVAETGILSLTSGGDVTSGGDIVAAGRVYLRAASYESTSVASRLAGSEVDAAVTGAFTNLGLVSSTGLVRIDAGSLSNGPALGGSTQGSILAGNLNITTTGALTNAGAILAQTGYRLQTGGDLTNSGTLSGGTGADLLVSGALRNDGTVAFNNALTLTGTGYTGGAGSTVMANGITGTFSGAFTNAGTVVSASGLTIAATDLANSGAESALSARTIRLDLSGGLANAGQIGASETLRIAAHGTVNNSGALLAGGGTLDLVTSGQVISSGDIIASGALTLTANGYNGSAATSRLGGSSITLGLGTGALANLGLISTAGTLDVHAGDMNNTGSVYGASVTLQLSGNASNSGLVASTQDLVLHATGGLTNTTTGQLMAARSSEITLGGALTNNGQIAANDNLTLRAASYLSTHTAASLAALTLDVVTSGAFDSAGRVIGQNGLTLEVGSLALRGANTVMGGASTGITVHGTALNEGTLVGTNGLSLVADGAITNSGTLQSDLGNLVLHGGGALTNAGAILAGGTLDIRGASLASTGAGARIGGTDVTITLPAGLSNEGLIIASRALNVHASDLSNLGAASVMLGNRVDLTLTGQARNEGALQSLTDLTLSTGGAFQNPGTLAANHDATLRIGGALTNGGNLLVNNALDVRAASLATTAGSQLGGNDTTITITGNASNGGLVFANNQLRFTAGGDLANASSGEIQATDLSVDITRNFSNAGTVRGGLVRTTVHGGADNTGRIESLGDLDLNVSGAIRNAGIITAANTAVVHGASLVNAAGARLDATQVGLTLTGALENRGTIAATDLLAVSAASLLNQGTAGAPAQILADRLGVTVTGRLDNLSDALLQGTSTAQVSAASVNDGFLTNRTISAGRFNYSNNLDLTLTGSGYTFNDDLMVLGNLRFVAHGDIVNNATVAAGGTLLLGTDAGSILNNENAIIYSVGNMQLAASGSVVNTAATIQSLGNMDIEAGGEVRNTRGAANLRWETQEEAWAANNAGERRQFYVYGSRLWSYLATYQRDNSSPAMLYAQGDMSISSGAVINDASTVIAGGKLEIATADFVNSSRLYEGGYHFWKLTGADTGYRGFGTCLACLGGYLPGDVSPSTAVAASISVGGDFIINATNSFSNTGSVVSRTASIDAPTVVLGITDPNVTTPISRTPNGTIDLASYIPASGRSNTFTSTSTTRAAVSGGGANIGAGVAGPVIETSGFAPQATAVANAVTVSARTTATVSTNTTIQTTSATGGLSASVSAPAITKQDIGPQTLPPNKADSELRPVVLPVNPAVTSVAVRYLNSSPLPGTNDRQPSWILGQVGDARSDLTFFADPATERRLIQQALVEQTGRSVLDPTYRNPQAQQEALYQGTVDFLKANPEIKLGDTLTEDQKKKVTTPIVWYENRVIDGQIVLVPQIILPPGDLDRYTRHSTGEISAENIHLTGGSITNTGQVVASADLTIRATEFINNRRTMLTSPTGGHEWLQEGGVLAGENIIIRTDNSLTNRGGSIVATKDISLTSLTGEIINEASRGYDVVNLGKGRFSLKPDLAAGTISAGEDLTISALDGAFINTASNLGAVNDLTITAKDGISIESIAETYLSQFSKSGGLFSKSKSVTVSPLVFSSSIRSLEGDITLQTDGDLKLAGGSIEATFGSIEAHARDILLETVSAEGFHKTTSQRITFTGASGSKNLWNDFAVSQPIIAAGADIKLVAAGDFTGRGAVLDAGGDLSVLAGGDLTFEENQNTRFHISKSWSLGLTYPGSQIIAAIERGGSPMDILAAAVSQDPLGAALVSLARGGGGGAAARTAISLVDLMGGLGRAYNNTSVQTGGTNGALDFLSGRISQNLNPFSQWSSFFNGSPTAQNPFAGFGNASFGINFSMTKSKQFWSESQRSSVSAMGDVLLQAGLSEPGNLSLLGGTNVVADGDIKLSGSNITIEALKDWNWSSTKTVGGGITISASGLTVSGNYSQRRSNGEDFSNAQIFAGGDLNVTTTGNMAVLGGSLNGDTVHVDVRGDLDMVSVQDWQRTRGFSISGGITFTPTPLPDSFGLGQVTGNRSWSEVSEIVGRGDTVINVGGNLDLQAATVASRTNQLNLTAGSLSHSDNADVDTYLDWSFGVSGLSRLLGGGGGSGTQSGSSLAGGINGSYTSRNMQGTTFATIGEGRVVIGGQENPLAQGTINRDITGRQIVTVNEGTHFTFDIPLVDFNQLSQNATSAFNLMQALTTPVPDDVAAMGSEGSDLYRRMIAGGMSVAQAQEMAQSEEFANAVAMRQNVDGMLARNGGSAQGLSRDQLLLTMLGESILTAGDNPLVSVDCNLAGTLCQVQLNALLASAGVSSIQDLVAQRLSSGDAKQVAARVRDFIECTIEKDPQMLVDVFDALGRSGFSRLVTIAAQVTSDQLPALRGQLPGYDPTKLIEAVLAYKNGGDQETLRGLANMAALIYNKGAEVQWQEGNARNSKLLLAYLGGIAASPALAAGASGVIAPITEACSAGMQACASAISSLAAEIQASFPEFGGTGMGLAGMAGMFERYAAKQSIERAGLEATSEFIEGIVALNRNGVKYTIQDIVEITKTPQGQWVWLEKGNAAAGLEHILQRHEANFADKGVPASEIPELILNTVRNGVPIGTAGSGGTIYRVNYGGRSFDINIVIGENGYVVNAYPWSR